MPTGCIFLDWIQRLHCEILCKANEFSSFDTDYGTIILLKPLLQ